MTMIGVWTLLFLLVVRNTKQVANEDTEFTQQRNDSDFDSTHVLFQSILFCGTDIICNKSLLTLFDIPDQMESGTTKCGVCSCSEHCFKSSIRNCCPDIFFRYGLLECRDVHLLSNVTHAQEVVASCPKGTGLHLSMECTKERSKAGILRNPPVTSSMTNISYMNKYCAKCNTASNLKEWSVMFGCPKPVDLNYLSSYQDIIDHAIVQSCNILFSSPNSSRNCSILSSEIVASCNVSGSWVNYDKHMDQACHSSYYAPMGIFKNIFCAICNPPEFQDNLMIEKCENSTTTYKEACSFLPLQEASFPYKNYFCSACNNHYNHTPYYTDVKLGSVNEFYEKDGHHPFQFTIEFTYNTGNVNQYIKEVLKTPNVEHNDPSPSGDEHRHRKQDQAQRLLEAPNMPTSKDSTSTVQVPTINITNLIRKSFAFSGHGTCAPGLLPNYTIPLQKPCSCTVGCIFDCCDDFALRQPWTCIDDRYNRDGTDKDYLAIGGCTVNSNMAHLCTGGNISQIYQAFPVTSINKYKVTYANIFCYFCNQIVSDEYDANIAENALHDLYIWPLNVKCSTYVNYRNFGSLLSLMNYINRTSCTIGFVPIVNASKCTDAGVTDGTINACDLFTAWLPIDEDIRAACEYSEIFRFPQIKMDDIIYKNKFCTICNAIGITENSCSDFPEKSSIVKACKEFPDINVCSPYKNMFCEICINNGTDSPCYEVLEIESSDGDGRTIPTTSPDPPPDFGTFRSTFTLADYDRYSTVIKKNKKVKCHHSQIFDDFQHTCINITCFPGKLHRNEICVSLLVDTSNLRYTIALKIEFSASLTINATVKEFIKSLGKCVTQKVVTLINTAVIVEEAISMSPGSCDGDLTELSEVFLYLKMFVNETVNRDRIEQKLIDFIGYSADWSLLNVSEEVQDLSFMNMIVSRSQQSLHLPSFMENFDMNSNCLVLTRHESQGPVLYRNVLVSPLLTCPHVLLEGNEFGVDWTKVRSDDSFLGFSNFSDRSAVRVCTKDIPFYVASLKERESDNNLSLLTILNLVCITASLLCLILTFITYCVFPNLRTLPGINNMFLVVSLFFSQLLMVVRPLFRSSGLPIVSALSHFSWLSTFSWLQVCSFHVFRVFNANGKPRFGGSKMRKTIYQYNIYAYGSSLIIVLSNIGVSLIVTGGANTGYDKTNTLMTYKTAFVTTLIAPLALICLTNVIFYVFTAYRICSTPKIEKQSGNRVHFTVYVRLFCLTGLSWILQIMDTFLELSVLTYIVTFLNGSQGVFIFVSYVCNERGRKLYRKVCCNISVFQRSVTTSTEADTAL